MSGSKPNQQQHEGESETTQLETQPVATRPLPLALWLQLVLPHSLRLQNTLALPGNLTDRPIGLRFSASTNTHAEMKQRLWYHLNSTMNIHTHTLSLKSGQIMTSLQRIPGRMQWRAHKHGWRLESQSHTSFFTQPAKCFGPNTTLTPPPCNLQASLERGRGYTGPQGMQRVRTSHDLPCCERL